MNVYVGGDVSKGYADFCLMDAEGEILLETQLDDTHRGLINVNHFSRGATIKIPVFSRRG